MRYCVGLVLLALAVTACGRGGAATATERPTATSSASVTTAVRPPAIPIRDPSTLLPCPRQPVTTIDIEFCEARKMAKVDAAVNTRAKAVFSLLGDSGRPSIDRSHFVNAETAWLAYRDAECTSQSGAFIDPKYSLHQYAGGTSAPFNVSLCKEALDEAHMRELESYISVICERRAHAVGRPPEECDLGRSR
jgi:uncharacterized protein YecT (DUF1311 family)